MRKEYEVRQLLYPALGGLGWQLMRTFATREAANAYAAEARRTYGKRQAFRVKVEMRLA